MNEPKIRYVSDEEIGGIPASKRYCSHRFGYLDTLIGLSNKVAKCVVCGEEFEVIDILATMNMSDEELIDMIRNGRRRDFINTIKAFYRNIPYSDIDILLDCLVDIDKDINDVEIARIFRDFLNLVEEAERLLNEMRGRL